MSSGPRNLHLAMSLSPTWLRGASWRRPDSRVAELFSSGLYTDVAGMAEAAHLDFLFAADSPFLDPSVLDTSPGFSTVDSLTLLSSLVNVTSRIGLVPTIASVFAQPFAVARQLQSLQHLSGGRAGWNLVTALGGQDNFTVDPRVLNAPHDAAAEFIAVVRRLWASYPAGAIVADRESGRFADASMVRPIEPAGDTFAVRGPLPVPAHTAGEPPLVQAGGSPEWRQLAGRHADAVFVVAGTIDAAATQRAALRGVAAASGRSPDDVRVLPGLSVVVAPTRAAATELAGATAGGGAAHWTVAGTPDDVATDVAAWAAAGAIDGAIVFPTGSWRSVELFCEQVVPQLVDRGLFRAAYEGTTLRDHLGLMAGPAPPVRA